MSKALIPLVLGTSYLFRSPIEYDVMMFPDFPDLILWAGIAAFVWIGLFRPIGGGASTCPAFCVTGPWRLIERRRLRRLIKDLEQIEAGIKSEKNAKGKNDE
jgi:hypothetical protein